MKKRIRSANKLKALAALEKKMKRRNAGAILLFIILKRDYIPKRHAAFDEWQSNFVVKAAALLSTWGISALNPDWIAVTDAATTWNNAWSAANPFTATRTRPSTVGMRTARADYEKALRYFVKNYLAVNKRVTPEQRATVGITIRITTKTYHPVPLDRVPDGSVNHVSHLSHELRLTDPNTPETKRKPKGVKFYRVYMTVADQGVTPAESDFKMVGTTSSYKFIKNFDVSQVGRRAHYFVKWVDARHRTGLPSMIFSQTII